MPTPETLPPNFPVGKGYALWLVPEEPMFSLLAGRVSRLSREYSTPTFDPHITLLSGITAQEQEILANSRLLASSLRPIRVELGEVGYLDEYFRCLFFKVLPASAIIKAHYAAQEAFGLWSDSPYDPHLSLMYGRLQLETKKKVAADLSFLSGQKLELSCLQIYRVSGPPDMWKCIEKFDLRLSDASKGHTAIKRSPK